MESDILFSELKKFKDFRNKIIHKINEDFSISLQEVESSIFKEYHPEAIIRLQSMIFMIYRVLDSGNFVFKAFDDFVNEYNLENKGIKILF